MDPPANNTCGLREIFTQASSARKTENSTVSIARVTIIHARTIR